MQLIRAEKGRTLPSLRLSIIETWLQGQSSTSMLTTKGGVHTGWRNMPVSGSMRQPETEERAQARGKSQTGLPLSPGIYLLWNLGQVA